MTDTITPIQSQHKSDMRIIMDLALGRLAFLMLKYVPMMPPNTPMTLPAIPPASPGFTAAPH